MTETEKNGITFYKFDNLSKFPDLTNFVSTRKGGLSKPPYDTLNFTFDNGDDTKKVLGNRKRFFTSLGVKLEDVVFCNQTHSDNIVVIKDREMKRNDGLSPNFILDDTDAVVTSLKNLALVVKIADCVPILLYDPQKQVIGAVHSGWRGMVKKILSKTVLKMVEEYRTNPCDLLAGIGPSAGPESYEVGEDVIQQVEVQLPGVKLVRLTKNGKGFLNLWEGNAVQLTQLGVPKKNIEISGIDTMTNTDFFFSHRREKPTGNFVAGIMMRS